MTGKPVVMPLGWQIAREKRAGGHLRANSQMVGKPEAMTRIERSHS